MKFAVCEECGNKLTPESMHCLSCGAPANHDIPTEVRCECGFLLCMLGEETVEVKCRRCKRIVYIPIEGIEDRYTQNKIKMAERRSRPPERETTYIVLRSGRRLTEAERGAASTVHHAESTSRAWSTTSALTAAPSP